MLSRVVRIPLRYSLSGAARTQFGTLPQRVKQVKNEAISNTGIQNQIFIDQTRDNLINFTQQVDGKKLILRSQPEIGFGYNLGDLSTTFFIMASTYGVLSNFNYILTIGCFAGAVASRLTLGKVNSIRDRRIIIGIEVDQAQRLHVTILNARGVDTVIVDKSKFIYNSMKDDLWGTKAIWCKLNGEDYWISQKNLEVNNHNIHHLL